MDALNSRCDLARRVLEGDVSEDDVYKYLDRSGLLAGCPGLVPYFVYTLHARYWNREYSIGVQYRKSCSQKHDDIIELFKLLAYEASHCRAVLLEAAGDRFIIWKSKVTL